MSWGMGNGAAAVKQGVENWYAEEPKYNYNSGGMSKDTGHFTQMVWKASKKLGIGLGETDKGSFTVGRYMPGGNNGRYKENVGPKTGQGMCWLNFSLLTITLEYFLISN